MRATIQTVVDVLEFSGHNFTFHENKNINESIFASNIFSQQPKDKTITSLHPGFFNKGFYMMEILSIIAG